MTSLSIVPKPSHLRLIARRAALVLVPALHTFVHELHTAAIHLQNAVRFIWNPNSEREGATFLMRLCAHRDLPLETITLLIDTTLDAGADIDHVNTSGTTALCFAMANSNLKMVRALLERGADPNLADADGSRPLHDAATWVDVADEASAIVAVLLEYGADPNAANVRGETPLHLHAAAGHTDAVRRLLDAGADVNAHSDREGTPLHGVDPSDLATAQLLIEAGANPRAKGFEGEVPRHPLAKRAREADRLKAAAASHMPSPSLAVPCALRLV